MTHITFLSNAPDRLQAAAGWLADVWREGKSVLVFAPAATMADRLDRLLWTQAATGFVPHCRVDSPLAGETPILIAGNLDRLPQDRCLLNLSDEVPPGFSRFEELIEIVSTEDAVRLPARERFRFYRERGYAMKNHNIAENG